MSQFSTDGGLTWSPPVRAGAVLVGTQPVMQPNGTLVVVAGDYRDERALSGSMIAYRSTDGGATFTRFVVSDLQATDNAPMRAISLPSVEADSNGTIYATWSDCRFRTGCSQNDLVLSTSTDGMTWTCADARDLRRRTRSYRGSRPIRRIPAGSRSCTRTTTARAAAARACSG